MSIAPDGWIPEHYCDEWTPPPRTRPEHWLTFVKDGIALAPPDVTTILEHEFKPLQDGEIVEFVSFTDYGTAILSIAKDGTYETSRPMPPGAEQCYAIADPDTLGNDIAEVVYCLIELGEGCGKHGIAYFTYSEPVLFRFDLAGKRFIRVSEAAHG